MGYPGKGKADYYAPGEYNVACFQCGRKFKSSQMFKHWQGYLVCRDHWEPRHPQDYVKSTPDQMGVPNAQPQADTYTFFCTAWTSSAMADYGVADCMRADAGIAINTLINNFPSLRTPAVPYLAVPASTISGVL